MKTFPFTDNLKGFAAYLLSAPWGLFKLTIFLGILLPRILVELIQQLVFEILHSKVNTVERNQVYFQSTHYR